MDICKGYETREESSKNDQEAPGASLSEAAQEGKTSRFLESMDTSFIHVSLHSLNELLLFALC